MDLKIKKYYIGGGTPGGGTGDQDITTESKLIIDSKFRRETSNFKVNFDVLNLVSDAETPILIKYIEKNLKPEELLGLVVSSRVSAPNRPTVGGALAIIGVQARTEELGTDLVFYELYTFDSNPFFYVPSTGALSQNEPYVEDTTAKDIRIKMYATASGSTKTVTIHSIESGLSPEDFIDVPVEMYKDGQLYMSGRITSAVLNQNGAIILLVNTVGENPTMTLAYNPSTGDLVPQQQSQSHDS